MTYQIVPTTEQHVDGFERVFDRVTRELRYFEFTEAPQKQIVVDFLTESQAGGWPLPWRCTTPRWLAGAISVHCIGRYSIK
jgi:hypothetical protein